MIQTCTQCHWEKFNSGLRRPIPGPLTFWGPHRNLHSLFV